MNIAHAKLERIRPSQERSVCSRFLSLLYQFFPCRFCLSICLFSCLLSGCGGGGGSNDAEPATPAEQATSGGQVAPAATGRIVFFGDSLTSGYTLGPSVAYPAIIQEDLRQANLSYTVVNAGVTGDTTADGLARIESVIQAPISVFFLALGANDGMRDVPVAEMEANLQGILDRVKRASPSVVLVVAGMIPLRERDDDAEFRAVFPRIAQRNSAVLLPFLLEGVYGHEELYLDRIHPNADGHRVLAASIWQILLPLLT